jgi:hypothetical protein
MKPLLRPCLSAFMYLLTSAAALPAQIPDSAFKPAGGSGKLYRLLSPVPLDWAALARVGRPDFQPSHPDTTLLQEHFEEVLESTLIPFRAPLPRSVPAGHFWVLAESGAVEVHPQQVYGSIAVEVDSAWQVSSISYGGILEAVPQSARDLGLAYFAFFTPATLKVVSTAAAFLPNTAQPTVQGSVGSRTFRVTFDSTLGAAYRSPLIASPRNRGYRVRALEILETGQVLLLVRWDNEDCEGASSLYDITTGKPRFVSQNHGNCGE